MIWSASIRDAARHQEMMAERAENRVAASKTPNSNYCRELKALAKLHREAARLFKEARQP